MDASAGTREWDAGTYDRVSAPQQEWAGEVIDRLELGGDESVLDAGCGSGRVTQMLLDRLPAGRVVAVDGSAAMIAEAHTILDPDRTTLIHADLVELKLDEPVDAVFSNAVFHWILDHDRLLAALSAALRPGGRLEAQCGGKGNTAKFYATVRDVAHAEGLDEYLADFQPHKFAGPEETEGILEANGFVEVSCGLVPRPVHPPEPREFIRSVCLGAHLELLSEDQRVAFLEAMMERLGPDPELDYIRLNISARKKAVPASS
jgi:trans-aconitate 2-methyltransferase